MPYGSNEGFCSLVHTSYSSVFAYAACICFCWYGSFGLYHKYSASYDALLRGGYLTTPSGTLATILNAAGEIVTEALSWVSDVASTITSTPLILLFVLVAFVGLGVGLVRRMIRL